jgi:putative transposase
VPRACRASDLAKATWYGPIRDVMAAHAETIEALRALVARHGRWGSWKCLRRLRLDGYGWNRKRVWRVYCQLKLNLPRRTRKQLLRERQPPDVPMRANALWPMDFMADTL